MKLFKRETKEKTNDENKKPKVKLKKEKEKDKNKPKEVKKNKNKKSFFTLSPKNKNDLYAFFSSVILLLTIAMLMFPELIPYENSIENLSYKKDQIKNLENAINSNESLLSSLNEQVKSKDNELVKSNEKVAEVKKQIGDTVFKLDVPSMLITLENVARENDIDIVIDYAQFKENIFAEATTPGLNEIPQNDPTKRPLQNETNPSEVNPEVNPNENDINNPNNSQEQSQPINSQENENSQEDLTHIIYPDENKIDPIGEIKNVGNGVNIASIPVYLTGDFVKVRDFARILDNIDFFDPVYIHINSEGETVSASFLLYIYYREDI